MKNNLEQPAPADGDLFQQALEGVTPLKPSNRILTSPPAPYRKPGNPTQHPTAIPDGLSDHATNDEAATSFLRPGLNRMTLRKLRRGQWPVQDSIDLHGNTSDEARRLIVEFLQHAQQKGMRCVNVIHGKGWRAEGGEGILKIRVRHWLAQMPQVMAFCEAPAHSGGGGAVWVLIASSSKT